MKLLFYILVFAVIANPGFAKDLNLEEEIVKGRRAW